MTESVVTVDWENGYVEASSKDNNNVGQVCIKVSFQFISSSYSSLEPWAEYMMKHKYIYRVLWIYVISSLLTDIQGAFSTG